MMERVYCYSCRMYSWAKPIQTVAAGIKLPGLNAAQRYISYSRHPQYAKTGFGKGVAARVQATLDEETVKNLQEQELKYKQHPGVFRLPKVELPEKFRHAVEQIVSHENLSSLVENADSLRNYLWSRKLPVENESFKDKVSKIEDQLRMREEAMLPFLSENETMQLEKKREAELLRRLRKTVYHWEPIGYDRRRALEYVLGRSAGEYATLCRIFNEISKRDPQFKPSTLCDFGSGVGTVTWAARQYWHSSLLEHLCADISWEVHELAELILRGGSKNNDHPIPALFFRNHLPESYKIRYDLVVSAFSLMELPSARTRLETIDKLWKKTDQYLVIVESGTKAGFSAVQEARDFILGLGSRDRRSTKCYVFSPCPHSMECPRLAFDTIPCNFGIKYRPLYPFHHDGCANDMFSYVVIRRGYKDPSEEDWPRLVEEPLIRPRHVICRLCTKNAKLQEVVLTRAKHSLEFRVLAKRSGWGDCLPVHTQDKVDDDDMMHNQDDYSSMENDDHNKSK